MQTNEDFMSLIRFFVRLLLFFFYLCLDSDSELVLKNFERVSSVELKTWTAEMLDEEARILPICEEVVMLGSLV